MVAVPSNIAVFIYSTYIAVYTCCQWHTYAVAMAYVCFERHVCDVTRGRCYGHVHTSSGHTPLGLRSRAQ